MDELSLFATHQVDWDQLLDAMSSLLKSQVLARENERSEWRYRDFSVVAIREPKYDDDCGIPFSTYSHEISVLDLAMSPGRESEYVALIQSLRKRLVEEYGIETVAVRNLQSLVD